MRVKDASRVKPVIEVDDEEGEQSEESDESESMEVDRKTVPSPRRSTRLRKTNDSATVQSSNYVRGRRFWEGDEEEALKEGIVKYKHLLKKGKKGVKGIWWNIKHDASFSDR